MRLSRKFCVTSLSNWIYCFSFFETLSSRGPGHRPFTAETRVRIPLGSPFVGFYRASLPGSGILDLTLGCAINILLISKIPYSGI